MLNYGNCTKAKARCQRAKVCPEGLCVKTMLGGGHHMPDCTCVDYEAKAEEDGWKRQDQ